jgi:phosphoribosylformylglycinamidine synthase
MLLVAERGREREVYDVFKKWGLDAVQIGFVTSDGMLRVKDHGQVFAEIPNHALADGAPRYDRPRTSPLRNAPLHGPDPNSSDLKAVLSALLSSGDLCSKHWIWEQYDYQVRTNTVAGPGSDAAIIRIKGTNTSVAIALDGNGRYCELNPREGARLIVAECCRNLSTVGALPIATTNNLNFGNPERPEIMAQIVECIEGLAEACRFFEVPVTGGNVSLYNETLGTPILPTPVVGIVGTLPTSPPITVAFQNTGRGIFLLGGLGYPDCHEFGGTQYAKVIQDLLYGCPPKLDMEYERRVQAAIRELVRGGIVESAHDISDGGLAVAIAESSFGEQGIGADIRLESDLTPELLLFHEGPSRILVSTENPQKLFEVVGRHEVQTVEIGVTLESRVIIRNRGQILIDADIAELKNSWDSALQHLLRHPVLVPSS